MRERIKITLLINAVVILFSVFCLTGNVMAQAVTSTPTPSVATATQIPTVTSITLSVTPTTVTSLPITGSVKSSVFLVAAGLGIIVFALVF